MSEHSRENGMIQDDRLREFQDELTIAVRGEVLFDEVTRGIYSTDAGIYQISPVGLFCPLDHADVVAAVKVAAKYGIPLLPRGGGTSLSGQSVSEGLILDFSRHMHRILDLDLERGLVRVEPGVVLQQLNDFLRPHGLQFGPDVSTVSRAALGGMIGNNSAGSHSLIYGKTIDHVRELQVVLSNGEVIQCGPRSADRLQELRGSKSREGIISKRILALVDEHRREIATRYPRLVRRVSGYNLDAFLPEFVNSLPVPSGVAGLNSKHRDRADFNLSRMIVGAEGTLGIVTEATLHVVPRTPHRGVACLTFDSIDSALKTVPGILQCGPTAVELIDKYIVQLSRENLELGRALSFVEGEPAALLVVEFAGHLPDQVDDGFQLLERQLQGTTGLQKIIRSESPQQADRIWRCREAGAPLLLSIPGAQKPIPFVEDTAVDPARLPDFTRRFREILTRHGVEGAYYGHASVGCLHIRPMLDVKVAEDRSRLEAISSEVVKLVQEFKGALSGEHGDGLARSYHNEQLFGPRLYQAFREVKRLFDPLGIMNPGKIVDAPGPTEHLRYGDQYQPLPVLTTLDFSAEARQMGNPEHGFLAAAEMCNGSGVCRKTHTGTMCPSFMVTHDEIHSTRGRANALRLALSGQLGQGGLTSERMYEVMDLCLQCKGCKAECPSNVDVAKLKVEFLGQYHARHGVPWRKQVLGNIALLNRIGSATAPFSNWGMKIPGVRLLMQAFLGIDRRRSLPRFHRRTFQKWFSRHVPEGSAGSRGTVVLLDDCLTSHCEPQINQSAVTLLERMGYRVVPAGLSCCGRPLISLGLLDAAKRLIHRNLGILQGYVNQGWPILGTEPSCLLTLVDEYPSFFPMELTNKIRESSSLLDGWIAARLEQQPDLLEFEKTQEKALLHGHCQQKALVGMQGTRQALQSVPGLSVAEVDSGCCGMAGSFGYDHFEISNQIGERVLLPGVRQHAGGPVIAPGFSCRHQIQDGCGTPALHPIELLAQRLKPLSPQSD